MRPVSATRSNSLCKRRNNLTWGFPDTNQKERCGPDHCSSQSELTTVRRSTSRLVCALRVGFFRMFLRRIPCNILNNSLKHIHRKIQKHIAWWHIVKALLSRITPIMHFKYNTLLYFSTSPKSKFGVSGISILQGSLINPYSLKWILILC